MLLKFTLTAFFIVGLTALEARAQTASASPGESVSARKDQAAAQPSESDAKTSEAQFNHSVESLSNGFGVWREDVLNFSRKLNSRQTFYAAYRRTQRFGQTDNEGTIGIYQPLSRKWNLILEGSASPTSRILPKWSAFGQIERNFSKGWNASVGYRRTAYRAAKVNLINAGAERYWRNWRAAYTLYVSSLENGGSRASHRVQLDRYYGERANSVGVGIAAGSELESLGRSGGVLATAVRGLMVSGRHWFKPEWGVNYGLTLHRQGDLYVRRGVYVGLRYRF